MKPPSQRAELWLWGFMGAGKSTVGRAVAEARGLPFVDVDASIEEEAGCTIPQLFAAEGEAAFRARERRALERLLVQPSPRVVALGGGALVDPGLRARALASTFVVTLVIDAETTVARAAEGRPLLATKEPRATAQTILDQRRGAYAGTHAQIDARADTDEVVAAVLAAWA